MSTDSNRILQAVITKYVRDKLEPGYLESNTLVMKLTEKNKVTFNSGGLDLSWPVKKTRNPNWESFAPFDKVDFVATDGLTMLNLDYAAYRNQDFLPKKEKLQNSGNHEKIFDLERQKVDDLVKDSKIDLNIGLHSGDGTSDTLVGIQAAVPDTNFTNKSYGGVAFTGNTWHQNAQIDGNGYLNNDFALDAPEAIENAMLSCTYDKETGSPDFGLTTKSVYAKIGRIHTAGQRYTYTTERKIGGTGLVVNGIEIMWDDRAQASVLRLLNSNEIEMFFMTEGIFDVQRDVSVSPSGVWFYLECFPLLRVKRSRYHAAIHNC